MKEEIQNQYFPRVNVDPISTPCPSRQKFRDQLAMDMAAYKAKGGEITECPPCLTSDSVALSAWERKCIGTMKGH